MNQLECGKGLKPLVNVLWVRFSPRPEELEGALQFAAKFVGWLKGEPTA